MKYNVVATIVVLSSLAIIISVVSIDDYYTNQPTVESDLKVIEPITTTDDYFELGPNGIDTNRRLLNDKDIANLLPQSKITPEPKVIKTAQVMTVEIIPYNLTVCELLDVTVVFSDGNSNIIDHVNYDIVAYQNDETILSVNNAHRHPNQELVHQSDILLGFFPVSITVTQQGIGHGDDIIESIDIQTGMTFTPQTAISVDCEDFHVIDVES